MKEDWYFAEGGTRSGPHSQESLAKMASSGGIARDTLVWNERLKDWEQAAAHFHFPSRLPPPLPGERSTVDRVDQDGNKPEQEKVRPGKAWKPPPALGFFEAFEECIFRTFTYSGRASRSEYWYFFISVFLIGVTSGILNPELGRVIAVLLFFPMLSVTARRLHDTDRSGWWYGAGAFGAVAGGFILVQLIETSDPLVEVFALLYGVAVIAWGLLMFAFCLLPGTPGRNRFG